MSELPKNWARYEIGDVTTVVGGGTPSSKDPTNFANEGGIPWITPSDLSGYKDMYIRHGARNLTEKGFRESSAKILPAGSVLFSSRAPIGYVAIAANEVSTNQGFKSFILPEELESRFVYFYLRYIKPIAEAMATGTTFKELSGSNAAKLPLLVAPFPEQKRIADKLGDLLRRVDTCQEHLDRVPEILRRFRQSVLKKAISGEITSDWRQSQDTPHWKYERADDVCEKVQSGGTPREGFIEDPGIPFLKVYNIVDQKIDFYYRPQYVTNEIQNGSLAKSRTKPGDVLMNIVGPPLGKVAIVPDDFQEWNINQAITLFRPSNRIVTKWIYYFLCSGHSISEIIHETRGSAGQSNISLSQCRDFIFPVPPIDEQDEIVRRVEGLFAFADRLEARWQAAQVRVGQLTPSLLAKAFRGKLVEQVEGEESAGRLLERIKVARAAQTKETKRAPQREKSREIKMTEETVKESIFKLPKDNFSFDELREIIPGNYEQLKTILFALLSENNPVIGQIFDDSAKAIRFVRRSQ